MTAGALRGFSRHLRRLGCGIGMAWALPCTLVGAALGLPMLLAGGGARRHGLAIEVCWHRGAAPAGSRAARLPFAAITLGQVILGVSAAELARLRLHEHVHVRQYLWFGPLFFLAYPLASLVAVLRGQGAHAGNAFETHAVRHSSPPGFDAHAGSCKGSD
ncbi:MAG: signal peptide prediction [Roseateles sp.]|uniref:signal peptide prediction n=1 Tax=Roseateles sp. TaxID=1971397 RepID=UPI0039EC50E8